MILIVFAIGLLIQIDYNKDKDGNIELVAIQFLCDMNRNLDPLYIKFSKNCLTTKKVLSRVNKLEKIITDKITENKSYNITENHFYDQLNLVGK